MKLHGWGLIVLSGLAACSAVPVENEVATNSASSTGAAALIPLELSTAYAAERAYLHLIMLDQNEPEKEQTQAYWLEFKTAQNQEQKNLTELACAHYANLAEAENFALRELAWWRAQKNCSGEFKPRTNNDADFAELINDPSPWVHPITLDIRIATAQNDSDSRALLNAYWDKSKLALPKKEKLRLTEEALSIAKQLELTDIQTQLENRRVQLAPRLNTQIKAQDYLDVAYDWRLERNYEQSKKFYIQALNSSELAPAEKIKAMQGLIKMYKVSNQKPDYLKSAKMLIAVTRNFWRESKNKSDYLRDYHDAYVAYIRALWTEGRIQEAQSTLSEAIELFDGKLARATLFWLKGRMAEEQKDFSAAQAHFVTALKELDANSQQTPSQTEMSQKIRWYLAWNHLKLGQYAEAILKFLDLKAQATDSYEQAKFQFWLGRALAANKQIDASRLEFEELIKNDPLGYYGLLAHRELKRALVKPLVAELTAQSQQIDFAKSVDTQLIYWLLAVSETQFATQVLNSEASRLRRMEINDQEVWLKLYKLYAQAGQYLDLFRSLGELKPELRKSLLERAPELIFPEPYKDIVTAAAATHQLPQELIYAIIRQESAFAPEARSHMDALGLMQLLPSVAKTYAHILNAQANQPASYSRPEDLFRPEVNIQLGAAHLKQLFGTYQNQLVLAVAAYNANGRAIRNWMGTRFNGDTLQFIEDIPYEETKGYVKLVLRNMIFYSLLDSSRKDATNQGIDFPEWALDLKPLAAESS